MMLKQNYVLCDNNIAIIRYDTAKNIMIINVIITEEGIIFQNLYYILTLSSPDIVSLRYMSGVFEYMGVPRQVKVFTPADSNNNNDADVLLRYYLEQLPEFVNFFIATFGLF